MATPPSSTTYAAPLAPTAPPVSAVAPATIAALAGMVPAAYTTLAVGLFAGLTAAVPAVSLVAAFVSAGIAVEVAEVIVAAFARPPAPIGRASRFGVASLQTRRAAHLDRAVLLVNSAVRCQQAWHTDGAAGLAAQLRRERRYFAQHLNALRHRAAAAAQVDAAHRRYGRTLGWYLGAAKTHTPECVAAAGNNFPATRPPIIGWPGTVHARCACHAGPPHPDGGLVDDAVMSLMASGAH